MMEIEHTHYSAVIYYTNTRIKVAEKNGKIHIELTNSKCKLLDNLNVSDSVITLVVTDDDTPPTAPEKE